ncbi:retrotransposon gag domain, retroviral aspartyl protease [Tanacetum coccineum]
MSDMRACLNDLSYIPLNNEQNEPTQGDIGETSNDPTQAKRNEFEELYASANEELYPGCDYVTQLDFMAKFTYFKVKGDANKDVHFCPVCNTSRWKDSNTLGKKVPKKVLRYFFIIPRLQRLSKSSHTAKEMTWHATGKCTKPGKMQHPVDGRAWKDFDTKYPDFAAEPRSVRLSYFILTLLIPGPKSPGKDIDVYLRPLIDDLKDLWAKPGVETIDVDTCLKFNMRAMVFMSIKDFSSRSSFSLGESGQGYKACPTCNEDTPSVCVLAKPEGSIAEGYVAEEALTFSSHYFRDVTTKFNRPNRNVDCPPPTCQFQVFKSLCKSIGLRSVIRINHQELKKVIWYILHNSPEIDTYRAKFKSEFPNKDMKEEFPDWFGKQIRQRYIDNDLGVSKSSELFALACGPSHTLISVNSCVVNGVRFVVHSRDERRTTQNSGICLPGPRRKTANGEAFKNDQYILATQVKQCFYLEDMARRPLGWKVVEHVSHKKFSNGGVIVVEDDPDVIHVDNSSDLALSTSLNDLEIAALHIDGQSIDVDAPPDIIDVVDEDDDIIDEEDPIPHDLADSDDEDLINLDIDDGVNVMSADVARGHGGDGGGDDRPPPHQIPTGCGGCLGNRGKGTLKPNLGGSRAGRLHTCQETRNLKETLMPLDDHAAHWANYLGELIRELPLHHPSWHQVPPEQKAGVMAKIEIYNGKKAALKERHWIPDSDGTYDLERIRLSRPSHISEVNWDAQIGFWNDPKNRARAAQNKQNRAKSKVMESSATREYPSLIHTFFLTHTVNGVFLNPEDKALYDEMLRLQGLGSNTETGVPYTEDEIMAIVRGGKQRGHIPGVGRVLPRQGTVIPPPPPCTHSSDVVKLKKREKVLTRQVNMFMKLFRSDDKFSQMLTQLESQPEIGGGSGSGGPGDDEQGHDEDDGEDGEDEDDS